MILFVGPSLHQFSVIEMQMCDEAWRLPIWIHDFILLYNMNHYRKAKRCHRQDALISFEYASVVWRCILCSLLSIFCDKCLRLGMEISEVSTKSLMIDQRHITRTRLGPKSVKNVTSGWIWLAKFPWPQLFDELMSISRERFL